MFLSVVIPTYNRAKHLPGALSSLVDQTLSESDFEVIVVDDGSTDNTKELALSYQNKLNLKYINEGHGDVSRARNLGIKNAIGEILVFFDDDAEASSNWLEKIREVMKQEFVVVGRGKALSDNIWQYFAPHYDRGDKKLKLNTIWECNLAIKKEVFDNIGMFNEAIGWGHEGNEFATRCRGVYDVVYQPDVLIYHDYASGYKNYFKKQFAFGQKLIYLKSKEIKSFWGLLKNYDNIKGLGGKGDKIKNDALDKAPFFTKLWVKIIAKAGSGVHLAGSIRGYFKYREK